MPRDTWTPGNPSGTDRSYDRGGDRQRDIARRQAPPPERQHPFGGIDATRYAQNLAKQRYRTGVQNMYRDGNFGTGQGRGIRGFLGNIGNKLGAWAGNMRGGINPATGEYFTQDEYEDNVWNRRDQASIDRIRKTKGLYDTGVIDRDWDQSPLKNRLAGLEAGQWDRMNAMGMPIGTTKPGEEVAEEMIYPERKPFVPPASEYEGMWNNQGINQTNNADEWFRNNPEVAQMMRQSNAARRNLPITERWANQTGMDLQEAGALKIDPTKKGMEWLDEPINWEEAGAMGTGNAAKRKMMKANPDMTWGEAANMARKNQLPFGYSFALNPALKELDYGGKEGLFKGTFGEVEPQFENIIGGQGRGFLNIADPELKGSYQENLQTGGYYDEPYEQYLEKNYPKTIPKLQDKDLWLAQGGRVEYNTGGRVGILSIF